MRYFYDTEFIEDGRTLDLISIGIVAEDGREYYAVASDAPWKRIRRHEWLMANVVPSLPRPYGDARNAWIYTGALVDGDNPAVKPRSVIATEVATFLTGPDVELWADYAAYDHVVLCQLWGPMADLPAHVPMWTNDIQTLVQASSVTTLPDTDGRHNALTDARTTRNRWVHLQVSAIADAVTGEAPASPPQSTERAEQAADRD